MMVPRRKFLELAAGFAAVPALPGPDSVLAQLGDTTPQPTADERAAMADLASAFMEKYAVPGLSIAVGHGGTILYQGAFGLADRENKEPVTPRHLFRIASVTKTITSVAIFSLIEAGRISLTATVFGPDAITGTDYGRPPYNSGVDQITVEHLLTHTCGGWSNKVNDPMFHNPSMNQAELIQSTLRIRPLDHPPGQNYAYSNFGYCVLGRVIEKIARQPYADYAQAVVLKRCGVADMTIAGNTLAQRRSGEVRYYGQGDNPYGMNVTRMDSHGGWIATPTDLVQFFMHVDGFDAPPNILKPDTIQTMTTASAANANYANGWEVNKVNNWWHNGFIPGTSAIAVRTHSGFCWGAITNTRANSAMDSDLDKLNWNMVRQVKAWQV